MSSSDAQLVKKRMLRHAQRGLPNVLKARFSPTAIWTTDSDVFPGLGAPTAASTTDPLVPVVTPTTTNSIPVLTLVSSRIPSTATPTVVVTPTLPVPIVVTSSSTSNALVIQSSSTTTSSLSTSSSVTPTTTTPSSTLTTSSPTTAFVTRTVSSHTVTSGTSLGSASSATASGTSSSGMSTAGIIGISAAGIVGVAVVAGLVMFFLRRWNRKQDTYDPDDFRRQSTVLRDDNSSLYRGNSSGRGGPRPPTMFERHNQNMTAFAIPTSNAYRAPDQSYDSQSPFNDFPASQAPPSFSPGYVPGQARFPAPPMQYANVSPFYNPPSQSPVGSPVTVSSYGGAAYDAQGRLVRAPSNANASLLSRNNSVAQPQYPTEESDYADLSRASVTPFQAAQYAAISKQLNIPPPMPVHQVFEAGKGEEPQRSAGQTFVSEKEVKPASMVSPFEDPHASTFQAVGDSLAVDNNAPKPSHALEMPSALDPDSRITSIPPSLPEIRMMSGSFSPASLGFPVTPSPRHGSFDVHSGRASPKVDMPPLSPVSNSPQRARFVDGLEARAHDGHETPVEIAFVGNDASTQKVDAAIPSRVKSETPTTEIAKNDVAKRPETVYDPEDAYGGI